MYTLYTETVSVTFTFQEYKKKMMTVTQPRSGKPICPVIIWAKIVLRVLSYEGTLESSTVNTVQLGKTLKQITRDEMLTRIRHIVDNMNGLGFTGKEVWTHSVRSSLAMVLYLSKGPVSMITVLSRWSSGALLLYIRRQIQDFSIAVSSDMISNDFFHYTGS